jgi:hypothetical protein
MKIEHSHDRARHFTTDNPLTDALAEIERLKEERDVWKRAVLHYASENRWEKRFKESWLKCLYISSDNHGYAVAQQAVEDAKRITK